MCPCANIVPLLKPLLQFLFSMFIGSDHVFSQTLLDQAKLAVLVSYKTLSDSRHPSLHPFEQEFIFPEYGSQDALLCSGEALSRQCLA